MYDRILLPTDGSEAGNKAVSEAIELATAHGATIHALFVVNESPYAPELIDADVGSRLRTVGEEVLGEIRDRAAEAEIEIETEIREGTPAREIIDCAEDIGADVIVMGTHGRSGLDRYILGSVTERVVRGSSVPVLTVRKDA
ncbi:MAG: universal stress protein [Natronomonas sp.]